MRYRKLPIEVDAVQFTGHNTAEVADFMGTSPKFCDDGVELTTVHKDVAFARPGDWIISEVEPGRFYPCKPEIFAATYELA